MKYIVECLSLFFLIYILNMAERKSNFPFGAKLTALQTNKMQKRKKKQEIKGDKKINFFFLCCAHGHFTDIPQSRVEFMNIMFWSISVNISKLLNTTGFITVGIVLPLVDR